MRIDWHIRSSVVNMWAMANKPRIEARRNQPCYHPDLGLEPPKP